MVVQIPELKVYTHRNPPIIGARESVRLFRPETGPPPMVLPTNVDVVRVAAAGDSF